MKKAKLLLFLGLSTFALVANANVDSRWNQVWQDRSDEAARKYGEMIRFYYRSTGLDAYEAPSHLIALMMVESRARETDKHGRCIRSEAGALGLMQIMPDGALAQINKDYDKQYTESDLCDPDISIFIAVAYRLYLYKYEIKRYRWFTTAGAVDMAYNEGPGNAVKLLRKGFDAYSHGYTQKVSMFEAYTPTYLK